MREKEREEEMDQFRDSTKKPREGPMIDQTWGKKQEACMGSGDGQTWVQLSFSYFLMCMTLGKTAEHRMCVQQIVDIVFIITERVHQ